MRLLNLDSKIFLWETHHINVSKTRIWKFAFSRRIYLSLSLKVINCRNCCRSLPTIRKKCNSLLIDSFLLSLTYKYRKCCFFVKFSKWRFWWIYKFWSLLNPKITFLAFGLCVCVCYEHNSKTNKSRIFKFGILHLCHK